MAVNIQSSADLAVLHGVKLCVYSRAGIGKTMLNATAPNPIIISAEAGLLSLKRENIERVFGVNTPGINYEMPVLVVNTVDDLIEYCDWAYQSEEAKQFDMISLDSITEIGEVVLSNAKKQCKDPRQAYGELIEKMTTTIKAFRDLPNKHVYFSAKQEAVKDDKGVVKYTVGMPGSALPQQMPYLFDELLNLNIGAETDGTEFRYLRTQPDLQYEAKDRSGCLDELEIPNLTHIINKISG